VGSGWLPASAATGPSAGVPAPAAGAWSELWLVIVHACAKAKAQVATRRFCCSGPASSHHGHPSRDVLPQGAPRQPYIRRKDSTSWGTFLLLPFPAVFSHQQGGHERSGLLRTVMPGIQSASCFWKWTSTACLGDVCREGGVPLFQVQRMHQRTAWWILSVQEAVDAPANAAWHAMSEPAQAVVRAMLENLIAS